MNTMTCDAKMKRMVFLCALLAAAAVAAQTTSCWTNTVGGVFQDAANWDPGAVPSTTNAIAVFNRNTTSGGVMQKRTARGCMSSRPRRPGCIRGRGLRGVSSIAVSPDGRFVYSAAFKSDAVAVFKRAAAPRTPRKG